MKSIATLTLALIVMVSCNTDQASTSKEQVKIQLLRNATMKIEYAGKTFLTDPMLSPKESFMSFVVPDTNLNPTVDLPMEANEILKGTDAVLLSHAHPDHLDQVAIEVMDKALPLFHQPFDATALQQAQFTNAISVEKETEWEGIQIIRTGGKHGPESTFEMLGEVSGFVLKADKHPTIYWIGDCIWDDEIKANVEKHQPDIIITHSGGAIFMGQDRILMDAEETVKVAEAAPHAKVVAIHMESLDHCMVTRESLKQLAEKKESVKDRILIPADGETLKI